MTRMQFILVFHSHQPVGNHPRIIESVAAAAYRPLLAALEAVPWLRHAVHVSGPLLSWMEASDPEYLDRLGAMVARGQVEILTGGMYEPILAAIPAADRVAQVQALSDRVEARFGARPTGLWLTERVWDPQIVPDLVAAGVRYVFMDDRAFISTGLAREQLTAHFLTEEGGERLAIFPLDQRLRALMPWDPPGETEAYLAARAQAGQRVAVFGDDGEKFGAWPGTHEKVYGGWLRGFVAALERLADRVETARPSDVLAAQPAAGFCYLPTSTYSEMEEWALPPALAADLATLKTKVGTEAERFAPFLRGGHWKQFLVRYSEANRAHKKMLALRSLMPRRGRPTSAWEDLYAAQCNDAYWHGWFGGVYLPGLRHQTWIRLARVERAVRRGQGIGVEQLDLDLDGQPEVWVHSGSMSALVQPHRGGTLVEWTDLRREVNLLNVLTRRPEWYHPRVRREALGEPLPALTGEACVDAREALAYDPWDRASFRDRFLDAAPSPAALAYRELDERGDFAQAPYAHVVEPEGVRLQRAGTVRTADGPRPVTIAKTMRFEARGGMTAHYRLACGSGGHLATWFATELNLFLPALVEGHGEIRAGRRRLAPGQPGSGGGTRATLREAKGGREVSLGFSRPARIAVAPIRTVNQTEQGFQMVCQGHGLLIAWPVRCPPAGEWEVEITMRLGGRPGAER